MKYPDGRDVRLGDRVKLGKDNNGIVVCSIDTNEFTDEAPAAQWAYLKKGVMIRFLNYGLIYYETAESDLELVERAKS